MTLFGFLGFDASVLGQHAFSMPAESTKTLLHELHRLSTSASKVEGRVEHSSQRKLPLPSTSLKSFIQWT
jgi:hypothetical protein